jgi:SAM-dependent methyltransferase
MAALEARHISDLTFSEVTRGLRALSSAYVERRQTIGRGGALTGAGKRAAFALFYGPLHYLLVRRIAENLPAPADEPSTIVDLGCGTGAAGAAWAEACPGLRSIIGIDRHPWVLEEAARTYRDLGLHGRTRALDITRARLPRDRAAVIAAFTMNELAAAERDALLARLVDRARRGGCLLIVEPLAGAIAPWWQRWRAIFEEAEGRGDEWRFIAERPSIVARLDGAAGLDHRELTGRSLWLSA